LIECNKKISLENKKASLKFSEAFLFMRKPVSSATILTIQLIVNLMTAWLSILIPVYNVEEYLNECMQSVLSQCVSSQGDNDSKIEIILLDDQSTDNSFALMQKIAADALIPIKILQHKKNRGLSAARNSLIAAASGQYAWFLDSDDVLMPGAITQLLNIVKAYSPDLIMCDYRLWHTEVNTASKNRKKDVPITSFGGPANQLLSDPEQLFSGLYQQGKLHCWSKIFKRALWSSDLSFPEGKYFEDMALAPRLALHINTYYYTPTVWIKYRQRAGSILAVPSLKKIDDMTSAVKGVLEVWLKKCPTMSFSARFMFVRYCVKVYFFAVIELKKIGLYNAKKTEHYRKLLLQNVQCTWPQLLWILFSKGDVVKLLKLLRY
jgi:glycosyltransferase involved in cell wall biosynthesis